MSAYSTITSTDPPSLSHITLPTVKAIPDDDDHDICPVCDAECTCFTLSHHTLPEHSPHSPTPPSHIIPHLPSLKIKLTVPQSFLAKSRITAKESMFPVRSAKNSPPLYQESSARRRGRPPVTPNKISVSTKSSKKRKRILLGDSNEAHHDNQFPSFVSASAISSTDDNNEDADDDVSHLGDTDSSIEAEEESFIQAQMRGRAGLRLRLLGDDPSRKFDFHNAWVIPSRKTSEGLSDVEMDVDSGAEAPREQKFSQDDEDLLDDEENQTSSAKDGTGYIGLATGWTDDDDQEFSFDADLFFSTLSDEDSRSCSSDTDVNEDCGHFSDEVSSSFNSPSVVQVPPLRDKLAFEVTESWDGQIVFTNGLAEGEGILDFDFEAHAAQYRLSTSSSPSEVTNVVMSADPDGTDCKEGLGEGQGDTTDEELVDDDNLPNERAKFLFNRSFSISAINPLSTMSSAVRPRSRDQKPSKKKVFPKPTDILSRKFASDSDDHAEVKRSSDRCFNLTESSSRASRPRTGLFEVIHHRRKAIIDDLHKDIPSPHPTLRSNNFHSSGLSTFLQRQLLLSSPVTPSNSMLYSLLPVAEDSVMRSSQSPMANIIDLDEILKESLLVTDPEMISIRDGDLTPTNLPSPSYCHHQYLRYLYSPPLHQNQYRENYNNHLQKNRKETRREKKMKRQSFVPVHHRHHHSRHHYPNSKSRATSAMQRSNLTTSSIPPMYL